MPAASVPRQTKPSWPGSRQASGAPSSSRRSLDITRTPEGASFGSTSFSRTTRLASRTPSMRAAVGPWRSASSRPIERPVRASAAARPALTRLFPTPPLPLTTATTWRTVASRSLTRSRWATTCPSRFERSPSVTSAYVRRRRAFAGGASDAFSLMGSRSFSPPVLAVNPSSDARSVAVVELHVVLEVVRRLLVASAVSAGFEKVWK